MSLTFANAAPRRDATSVDAFAEAASGLRDLLRDDLERVNEAILRRLESCVPLIPDLAGHLVEAGGKRVRPMMTLAAARAFDYEGDRHIPLAAAVELIHGATLLHDDVVDESPLRRGRRTANFIWGNKESVLVGDFIFSGAFELMVAADNAEVLRILSRASSVIAEGEVLQLTTQNDLDTDVSTYLKVVEAKTAALFEAAAQVGAVIAGATPAQERGLAEFGRRLGVAYQLVDDALDYDGEGERLGKAVGDDFREGKMTMPVVIAFAGARDEAERRFWRRVIADGAQDAGDFDKARALMRREGAIEATFARARREAAEGFAALSLAPANAYSQALARLLETSIARAS